jgi:hypothetical protein
MANLKTKMFHGHQTTIPSDKLHYKRKSTVYKEQCYIPYEKIQLM